MNTWQKNASMPSKRRRRRDPQVDKIRSIFWYHAIAHALELTMATEVRKAIEPYRSVLNQHGQPDKNEKYAHFRSGKRMPNATLIDLANRVVPGSRGLIEHPLWLVLRHEGSIKKYAVAWTGLLNRQTQNAMFTPRWTVIESPSELQLDLLVKDKSLDSLAALTMLYRIAQENEDARAVKNCATAIYQLLILLGPVFETAQVGQLIYDVYVDRILDSATDGGYKRAWHLFNYDQMAGFICFYAIAWQKPIDGRIRRAEYYVMQTIRGQLPGQLTGFMPLFIPNLDIGPPTKNGAALMRKYREAIEHPVPDEACSYRDEMPPYP
ncbi:hypothetical protein [Herbaspirillum huttiense]|uniref:Uncharacterized protein n=2 Tax=Herbaspirillum huttiense TaxID=863372 RepID=A0AAJ2HDV4_9BURK|nr:hypothetical protein [Herbaspirillum huttiense]MDR9837808.1 hypothetical protein [Herbaspirillum huttiense]